MNLIKRYNDLHNRAHDSEINSTAVKVMLPI